MFVLMKKRGLKIISDKLLAEYIKRIQFNPEEKLQSKSKEPIPFDYFEFYTSTSTVYSSKIEGESIDVDSFFKHKFLEVNYEPDYTKRADDLYKAYAFMEENKLNKESILKAHEILSKNLLASNQRGRIRTNPMFVLNDNDRIEYIACEPSSVKGEFELLFLDIEQLLRSELVTIEIFYFAAFIHLAFVKIHPLQDGNGRTARLLEKWFLRKKIGKEATMVELEKNYYLNRSNYYNNIGKIGLEYESIDYSKSLDFLLMTINSLATY